MNTVRLKCDCCGKLIFFFADAVTGNNCSKASIIHLVLYLWPASPLPAERFRYCLRSNNVLTSSDGVNPPRRHGSFTSTTPTSLPSFYSNPMSYRRLSEVSFLSPWCCSGRVFPNPSRRFLWLTENRTLSYSESKLDCTKEWKQKSKKMVRKGMLSSTQSSEILEIIYSIDLISRPKKPDCSKCSRFFFGLLLCKSETCNYFLMNTMQANIRNRLSDRSVFSPRVWLMSALQLVYQSHPLTLLSNWKWLERFPLAGGVFQTVFLSSLLNSVTAVILGCRTPKSTSCGRQTLTDFGSFFIVKDLFPSWRQNPWTSRQKSRLCKHFWDDLLQRTHCERTWRNLQDYSS